MITLWIESKLEQLIIAVNANSCNQLSNPDNISRQITLIARGNGSYKSVLESKTSVLSRKSLCPRVCSAVHGGLHILGWGEPLTNEVQEVHV